MEFEIKIANIAVTGIRLMFGLILAIISVYLGIALVDRLTRKIDEWKEIKKGNTAVGILLASVVLSIAVTLEYPISSSVLLLGAGLDFSSLLFKILIIAVNMLISITIAIFSIYTAFRVIDKFTVDIDELAELKKGNTAVALVMGAIIFAVSFIIRTLIAGIIASLNLVSLVS